MIRDTDSFHLLTTFIEAVNLNLNDFETNCIFLRELEKNSARKINKGQLIFFPLKLCSYPPGYKAVPQYYGGRGDGC